MKLLKHTFLVLFTLSLFSTQVVFALNKDEATDQYRGQLVEYGLDAETAQKKAGEDVSALIDNMEASQYDLDVALDNLEKRVSSLMTSDSRLDEAETVLNDSKQLIRDFLDLPAQDYLDVQNTTAGVPPRVLALEDFEIAKTKAMDVITRVNQILIAPNRPGEVPTGDLMEDFIPQFVRQLFRFAWIVALLSLITSGIFFILAKGNDDRVSKARSILIFTLIGFVVITLAFAVVNAITDIDFFSFI